MRDYKGFRQFCGFSPETLCSI